jgi:hypothetical protein
MLDSMLRDTARAWLTAPRTVPTSARSETRAALDSQQRLLDMHQARATGRKRAKPCER